jgi:hypothetical protein
MIAFLRDQGARKELTVSEEIMLSQQDPNHINLDVPILPIVKGFLFKHSRLMRMHKRRFFVLNPNLGQLTRYKR